MNETLAGFAAAWMRGRFDLFRPRSPDYYALFEFSSLELPRSWAKPTQYLCLNDTCPPSSKFSWADLHLHFHAYDSCCY